MTTLQKKIIEGNENLSETQLLNWAMNQLFRASRTLDLLSIGHGDNIVGQGCDCTATCILKRLIKTKKGWKLVYETNRKLLRGYKKPLS